MKASDLKKLISVAVAALLILVIAVSDVLWMLEYRVQDMIFQRPGMLHPDIFVIGIDERALEKFGPYQQWPRDLMAEAVSILNSDPDFKPAVIGIDILYAEPSRNPEDDAALVAIASVSDNVVLASSLIIGLDRERLSLIPTVIAYRKPFPELLPHVEYGLINAAFDGDGVVRNAILYEYFQGERLYSFPVAVAAKYLGLHPEEVIQGNQETYIRYTGRPGFPGDFFDASFADIFDQNFDPSLYADAIVLIGPYALGMMDDHPVPILYGMNMYGVEIHANVVQVILDGSFKSRVSDLTSGLIITLFIILGMIMGEILDIRITLVISLTAAILYYFLAFFMYEQGYLLPVLAPLLSIFVVFLYQLSYGYVLQAIEKSRMRNTFKKYVDSELVDALIEAGETDSDAVGQRKNIAVLFVDVRGFTPMAEKLKDTPELIVEILNEYLELTSLAVFNNGGSVDKFIGDSTMALFNGFVPLEDYVYKSVKAAWDMLQGAEELNSSIKKKFDIDIGFGIGIHYGESIVGNLGPSFRKDYTAIGDTVNTAARLESGAAQSQVLISKDMYDLLKDRIKAESIGEITLKGKNIPFEVFSLTGLKDVSIVD